MRVEVHVGDFEHDCCGEEMERYQQVRFSCLADDEGRLHEIRHDTGDVDLTNVSGTIVDLELLLPDGTRTAIQRVPSGRALTGNDPHDDGVIVTAYTEEPLTAYAEEAGNLFPRDFIVTLELAR